MNEDKFNMDIRAFLKRFGVTAQREIEKAVREALAAGKLQGTETLRTRAHLEVEGVDLSLTIEGDLHLE